LHDLRRGEQGIHMMATFVHKGECSQEEDDKAKVAFTLDM
jgi:hypothetical protein